MLFNGAPASQMLGCETVGDKGTLRWSTCFHANEHGYKENTMLNSSRLGLGQGRCELGIRAGNILTGSTYDTVMCQVNINGEYHSCKKNIPIGHSTAVMKKINRRFK